MVDTEITPPFYFSRRTVRHALDLSEYLFRRLTSETDFPKPTRLPGINVEVWAADQVHDWMNRQDKTNPVNDPGNCKDD